MLNNFSFNTVAIIGGLAVTYILHNNSRKSNIFSNLYIKIMNFTLWLENDEEYLKSKEFGIGLANKFKQSQIDVDGEIVIDWRQSEIDHTNKRIFVDYQILNIDNKLVKSGKINYYNLPYDCVYFIIYELAKREEIYHPANLLLIDGQFSGSGVAQPQIDMALVKKYWSLVNQWLNA